MSMHAQPFRLSQRNVLRCINVGNKVWDTFEPSRLTSKCALFYNVGPPKAFGVSMSLQPLSSLTETRRVVSMLAEEFCERVEADRELHKRRLVSKVQFSYREAHSKEINLWIPLAKIVSNESGTRSVHKFVQEVLNVLEFQ